MKGGDSCCGQSTFGKIVWEALCIHLAAFRTNSGQNSDFATCINSYRHPSSFSLPSGSISEADPVRKENCDVGLNTVQASVFLSPEDT